VTVALLVGRLHEEQTHDRNSQQLIHGIINAIPGGVFWKDKSLVYLGCNAEFARGAGFADARDIIGKDDFQMLWRDQAEMYRADDREVIESGNPKLLIEEPSNTPEGTITTLLTSKIPLRGSDGEVTGVLGTYMDIAERIRKEELLRASQRQVEQMRDDLTHTMVHDLRSPLTTILATLEMVRVAQTLTPTLRDMTEIARSNARRQLGLIDSILSLSQLEQGAVPLKRSSFALIDLVTEVLRLAAPRASSEGIELINDVARNLPHARADRDLLSRVLDNLVGNAIKFTPAGGRVRVGARSEADSLRVCVRDTGAGVPEELRPRLFQKFAAGTQKERGSGLGLAFCRLVAEAHGGGIWLESEPNTGAAFVFSLPHPSAPSARPVSDTA